MWGDGRIGGIGGAAAATVAIALAAMALAGGDDPGAASAAKPSAGGKRPNIVVVMTDDQTVESMRVMPKVQRLLSDRGVSFTRSFVSNSICCPSRATFLTGRYAHNTGVLRNSPPHGGVEALDDSATLPVALQRSGYFTAHIGKYLNGYGLRTDPTAIPPGWDSWQGSVDSSTYRMFGYILNQNGTLVTHGDYDIEDPAQYQTDVYAQKATALIERRAPKRKPFFINIAPLAPHVEVFQRQSPGDDDPPTPTFPNPRPAPRDAGAFAHEKLPQGGSFNEADVSDKPSAVAGMPPIDQRVRGVLRARYRSRLGSLLAVDDLVGRLVRTLRDSGELRNTLILFTSDNGFLLGEHRIKVGKQYPYEESIRVPLIMRGPGIPHGKLRRSLAANVDLAPTILDYAGAKPASPADGISLRRMIEDRHLSPGRAIVLENWCQVEEACFDPDVPRYRGVRTDRYAYMEYPNGDRELYDLERDPDELRSLDGDTRYRREQAALHRLLGDLRDCRRRECRASPRLNLMLSYDEDREHGTRCAASAVEATVGGADAGQSLSLRVRGPGPTTTDDRRPLRVRIPGDALAGDADTTVAADVAVLDGRVETLTRSMPPACGR